MCNKFAAPDNWFGQVSWPWCCSLGAEPTWHQAKDNVMGRAIPPKNQVTRHGLINISSFKPPAPWPKTSISFFFQTKKSIQKMSMVLPNVLPKKTVGFFCKPQMGRESGCFSQISDLWLLSQAATLGDRLLTQVTGAPLAILFFKHLPLASPARTSRGQKKTSSILGSEISFSLSCGQEIVNNGKQW